MRSAEWRLYRENSTSAQASLQKKGALAALLQAEEEAYSNHVTAEVASATKHGNKFDGAACATKHGN